MSNDKIKRKKCKLKAIMTEQGYTQMALSEISGVPQTVISRYARGAELYNPSYLFALAESLKLDNIGQLFEDDDKN